MNIQQKTEIASLRSKGFGYTKIAQALGLSKNTVKSYCKRNNLSAAALESAALTRWRDDILFTMKDGTEIRV